MHVGRCFFLLLLALFPRLASAGNTSAPWHLPGWQSRAVVSIDVPRAESDVDTAAVRILCQGHAREDGNDYRVLDETGAPIPFQLVFHDAARYSLLAFRVADPRRTFYVYFDNSNAARPPERVADYGAPGSGPPQGAWIPRFGLTLTTLQRPIADNCDTIAQFAALLAASPRKHGARYQQRISDGYNPFGFSDDYLSVYRGWIRIARSGKYWFCTASNEGSFSFVDGKTLVHWPGRHTETRGMYGEKHAAVELSAGLHFIEYYHEELKLTQMAFLGWRPFADSGLFAAIPESVYTAPHPAMAHAYETAAGTPLLQFEPDLTDSVWPEGRATGQYTRAVFASATPALPAAWMARWDFGDGQTATGQAPAHIYLAPGVYTVTLTASAAGFTGTARWPLDVYEMQHITGETRQGNLANYLPIVRGYDRSRLAPDPLRELVLLLADADSPADALAAGKDFLARFGAAQPAAVTEVSRRMGDGALRLGDAAQADAIAAYQTAFQTATNPAVQLAVLARLIRLHGMDRNDWAQAVRLTNQVETVMTTTRMDDATLPAYRQAVMAGGDVLLWHGKLDEAVEQYRRTMVLGGVVLPANVRAARAGGYPEMLEQWIRNRDYDRALDLVDQWDDLLPLEKINGQTLFWRGKIASLKGRTPEATRYLRHAIQLLTGSRYETEARWLLAQALEKSGLKEESRQEWVRLVGTGLDDSFTKLARERLK